MALTIIPQKTNFKFINKRKFTLLLSAIILAATVFLLLERGFNYGIDFTGGILVEIATEKNVELEDIRKTLPSSSTLQKIDDGEALMIRLPLDESRTNEEIVAELKGTLASVIDGEVEYRKVDYVGPQVGAELIETAIFALLSAFGALLLYVWIRFEWQYAFGAVFSLLHDSVAVVGFFLLTQLEFDLSAVAAILTVVGYSINDTVVIYDRVRENMRKYKKMALEELLDLSVNETMSRTILTAGTTLLALGCLIIFGGEILKTFSLGMFFGVIIGTYSSIYVAALALLYLDPRHDDENE